MPGNQKTFHSSRIYIYVYQLRDQETDEMILCRASVSSELTVSFARLNYKTVQFHGRQPDKRVGLIFIYRDWHEGGGKGTERADGEELSNRK